MKLFTPEAMRQADQTAAQMGYPSLLLMEAAGRACAKAVARAFGGRTVAVLCGKGNNGGDGLVAARWLHLWGHQVEAYAASGQTGDAALAREALGLHGVEIHPLEAWQPLAHSVVLDALVGTGLRGPLEGIYKSVVERLQASGLPVVAVDIPSGLPYQPHLQAQLTVALAGLKGEHLWYPQRASCGQIILENIGMPPAALAQPGLPDLLEPQPMAKLLPSRSGNAHKGSVGRLLVVGGLEAYTGAPSLAALAAYRAGAGLVTVAHPANCTVQPPVEAVRLPLFEWTTAGLQLAKAEAVAVGMGAGDHGAGAALAALGLGLPTVLDADALHPKVVQAYQAAGLPTVITPHPGEASRLLDTSAASIAQFPLEAAQSLAQRYPGVVVVIKGGPSVIAWANAGLEVALNTTGNPAMATAGMGDVLAGVLGALLAAGLSPWDAARLGVYWHGLAGDALGYTGLLAHQVAEALPKAALALKKGNVRPFWEA